MDNDTQAQLNAYVNAADWQALAAHRPLNTIYKPIYF